MGEPTLRNGGGKLSPHPAAVTTSVPTPAPRRLTRATICRFLDARGVSVEGRTREKAAECLDHYVLGPLQLLVPEDRGAVRAGGVAGPAGDAAGFMVAEGAIEVIAGVALTGVEYEQ